jgi:toxin ParE1/3/4
MTRYLLRPRAQRDLEEIWTYTARTWSPAQAETYVRHVQHSCGMIAVDPRLGRSCDDIRAGYRKFRSGSHFLFYRPIKDGVEIVRILHFSMDFEQHL